jgi:hypothetical protein
MMNIIFEGDWVKFVGNWAQVIDIAADDMIQLSRKNDFAEFIWVNANSLLIEQILSDAEMQQMLQSNNQQRIEQRRKADSAILQSSSSESASLAGGSPRVQQRGAPYGSRV